MSELPKPAAEPGPAETYYELTEKECQCRAVQASTIGNLLEQKSEAVSANACSGGLQLVGLQKKRNLYRTVLHHAADEARNRSAGDALQAFYHLVEAEGRADLLRLSLHEVDESLKKAEEMQEKGLRPPVDPATLRRQLIELRTDQGNVRIAITQLNARLRVLLNLSADEAPIWPRADLRVSSKETESEQDIDVGLHRRPDLAGLQALAVGSKGAVAPVAGQVLGGLNPLLNEPAGSLASPLLSCLLGKVDAAQQQVQDLLTERTRQATEEIRQAAVVVGQRLQLVALAQWKTELEEQRLKELEEKKAKGLDVEGELSTSRLNVFKARDDRLHAVVEWKIAGVELRQAQGLLVAECHEASRPCESEPAKDAATDN